MTKNAQQALKYLLRSINNNVRFCLICNYITRIDESLQNEFMRLRFNQLPKNDIIAFTNLKNVYTLYKDIRIINYMSNKEHLIKKLLIILFRFNSRKRNEYLHNC